jgi:glycosyltransferase involved in cell wall biosynthesis
VVEHSPSSSTTPIVSAIIIFLNGQAFLREAIDSVLRQSYEQWELLLCDDGSTDASPAIAREYAAAHPGKVRYLEHEHHANLGMSAARNLGLRHAQGKYVAFVDADDIWLPDKLRDQVALLETHPTAAMLFGRTRIWFSWSGRPEDQHRDFETQFPFPPNRLVPPPTLLATFLRSERCLPCTCSVLIRRHVLDRVGGFEPAFRTNYEDMVLYSKIFIDQPVLYADGCWDCYRQHSQSSCAVALQSGQHSHSRPSPARYAYLSFVDAHLRCQGIRDGDAWQAVQEQLWPYRHPYRYRLRRAARRVMHAGNVLLNAMLPMGWHQRLERVARRCAGDRPAAKPSPTAEAPADRHAPQPVPVAPLAVRQEVS